MTRIVVLSIFFAVAGCDVGEIPLNGNGADGGGGGIDTSGSGDAAGNGCAAAVAPAPAAHLHTNGGTSNQGLNCMAGGACHGIGGAGGPFTWAGTVFANITDGTPNPGAQVRVKFGAMTLQATTDADGNFYSTQAVTFPAATQATKCPTVTAMVATIQTGQGQCNTCHARAAGTTAQIVIQ